MGLMVNEKKVKQQDSIKTSTPKPIKSGKTGKATQRQGMTN